MATRHRSRPVERRSWKAPADTGRGPVLFYRRVLFTVVSLGLVVLFAWLIIANLPIRGSDHWSVATLVLSNYAPKAAPNLPFAAAGAARFKGNFPQSESLIGTGSNDFNLPQALSALTDLKGIHEHPAGGVLLYVVAHGCSIQNSSGAEQALLLPTNFDPGAPTGLSARDLLAKLAALPTRRKLLIIDFGPLEHDLRLGMAVNRFSEILREEVQTLAESLKKEEQFIVLASHQTWEQSLVSPADGQTEGQTAFTYFLNAALDSPDNADVICPDRRSADKPGAPNQSISLAELARFVQQQVGHWSWQASGQTRTQRPLLLFADAQGLSEVDFAEEPTTERDRVVRQALQRMSLAKAPPAPAVKSAEARLPTADGIALTVLQAPKTAPPNEPVPASPPVAEPPAPQSTVPLAPTPPVEDRRPAWFRAQATVLDAALGVAVDRRADDWRPVDTDPVGLRQLLHDCLRQQQEALNTGRAGRVDTSESLDRAEAAQWRQAWVEAARQQEWLAPELADYCAAVRLRNAALTRAAVIGEALDSIPNPAVLEQGLSQWLHDVDELCAHCERPQVADPRRDPASHSLYVTDNANELQCRPGELKSLLENVRSDEAELTRTLLELLKSAAPFHQWELARAVPWPLMDGPGLTAPAAIKLPPLSVVPTASLNLPKPADVMKCQNELARRRRAWLKFQLRLTALPPATTPLPTLANIDALEPQPAVAWNAIAAQLTQRQQTAVKWAGEQFKITEPNATAHWQADRILRTVWDKQPRLATRQPMPLARTKLVAAEKEVWLTGPRVGAEAAGASGDIVFAKSEQKELVWKIGRAPHVALDRAEVKISLDNNDGAFTLTDRNGNPLDLKGNWSPLADLWNAGSGELALTVRATREVELKSELQPGGDGKTLRVEILVSRGRAVSGTALLRLPNPEFLAVQIEGLAATIDDRHLTEVKTDPALEAGRLRFEAPRDDSSGGIPGLDKAGCFHIGLQPFPREKLLTEYRLLLFNRSTELRQLSAAWYALGERERGMQADWPSLLQRLPAKPLTQTAQPHPLPPNAEWALPLIPPPPLPAAPPAGVAAPAAVQPGPKELDLSGGLVCLLTDATRPQWRQYLWITARPLRPHGPSGYLEAAAAYRPNGASGAVTVTVQPKPVLRATLPAGQVAIQASAWHDRERDPESSDVQFTTDSNAEEWTADAAPPLKVVAQVRAAADAASPLRLILDADGYPRELQFLIRGRFVDTARRGDLSAAYVQSLLLPPVPSQDAAAVAALAAPPSTVPLRAPVLFFAKTPNLLYRVLAEFPGTGNFATRLSVNGENSHLFREDRRFQLRALPGDDPQQPLLRIASEIGECERPLAELLGGRMAPQRVVIRAEIVRRDGAIEQPLAIPVFEDRTIVLDNQPPYVTQIASEPAQSKVPIGKVIACTIEVQDGDGTDEPPLAVPRTWKLQWSDGAMDGALVKPRSDHLTLLSSQSTAAVQKWQLAIPAELLAAPRSLTIFAQATDEAGNVSLPVKIRAIEVRPPSTSPGQIAPEEVKK